MHTVIVGYFAWQLFHSLATKSHKQIIQLYTSPANISIAYVTG